MNTKAVGIKDLRDHLSRYVREARGGTRILILDRDEVVAELHEPEMAYNIISHGDEADEMAKAGTLHRPKGNKKPCKPSPLSLPEGTAAAYLETDRADRNDSVR